MYNQELAERIIEVLYQAFPARQQLDQLKLSIPEYRLLPDSDWFAALDALNLDGRVEFAPLRSGIGNVLGMAADIRLSSAERERFRNNVPNSGAAAATSLSSVENQREQNQTKCKPAIFISCGQVSEGEKQLGKAVVSLVESQGYVAYFAENQQTLRGVSEHILSKLNEAVGIIAILHPRGEVRDSRDGKAWTRGSVWIEQEIAIAAFIRQVLGREIEIKIFAATEVAREGIRDKLLLNPIRFSQDSEVLDELRTALPQWRLADQAVRQGRHLEPILRARPMPVPGGAFNGERLFQFEARVKNIGSEDVQDYQLQLYFPSSLIDGALPYNVERIPASEQGYTGLAIRHDEKVGTRLYREQETTPLIIFNFVLRKPDEEALDVVAVVNSGNMPPVRANIAIQKIIRARQ